MKKIIFFLLIFSMALAIPIANASITYPTKYTGYVYPVIFYQTNINTTLAKDMSKDEATLTLTDASGFSKPGMLYFPRTREIMYIDSINGNTIEVNRDPHYTVGSGRFDYVAGDVVVFAHLKYVSYNNIQFFQNNAHVGDFVLFGIPYWYHILESITFNLTSQASYSSASFNVWELNYFGGGVPYSVHQFPIEFEDGTNGFRRNGTISFDAHESGLPYEFSYSYPLTYYNKVYDETGNGISGYFVGIELTNTSDWSNGVKGNVIAYQKVIGVEDESNLSWDKMYNKDKHTLIPLAKDDGIFRNLILYDDKNLQLDINISNFQSGFFSSSGTVYINALKNDNDMYAYFPFVKGRGYNLWDLRNYNEFAISYSDVTHDVVNDNWVYWTDGQFSGKKALHIERTLLGRDSHFSLKKTYPKLNSQFSVEVIFNVHSGGTIFTIGKDDYYHEQSAYPFRFGIDGNNNLVAELSTDVNNYFLFGSVSTDEWHYGVATFDGKTFKLYIDGDLVDSNNTISGNIKYATDDYYFLFGGANEVGDYFNGEISELAIWNRVLTETEVNDRYNNQQNMYLQEIDDSIDFDDNGMYETPNSYAYLLNVSSSSGGGFSSSFNYTIYQPRMNVIGKEGNKYYIYGSLKLKGDTYFKDTSNSFVQLGNPWIYRYRAFDLSGLTGKFTLGERVGNMGYNGGIFYLYNTYSQGTYKNYLKNANFYGTKIYISQESLDVIDNVSFINCEFQSLNIGKGIEFIQKNLNTLVYNWYNNRFVNIITNTRQFKPFYNSTTLQVEPDENTYIYTKDENNTYFGNYYGGGYHMGVTVRNDKPNGYAFYDYHMTFKTILVNFNIENGTFYVFPRSQPYDIYGSPTLGYTLKLKVVGVDGNPVSNAKVYIYDKDGYSAIFRPPYNLKPTDSYISGENSWGASTTLHVNNASGLNVGDVLNLYGERVKITAINGNTLTIERKVQNSGGAYKMMFYGNDGNNNPAFIEKQYPYLTTNATGEIPKLIIYTDYYKSTTDKLTKNPLTIRVTSLGNINYTTKLNLTKETELVITLTDEQTAEQNLVNQLAFVLPPFIMAFILIFLSMNISKDNGNSLFQYLFLIVGLFFGALGFATQITLAKIDNVAELISNAPYEAMIFSIIATIGIILFLIIFKYFKLFSKIPGGRK